MDSGLLASLPTPRDRATRASQAEGPHTRSASCGPHGARVTRDASLRLARRLRIYGRVRLRDGAERRRRRSATRRGSLRVGAPASRRARGHAPRRAQARFESGDLPERRADARARRRSIAVEEGAARVRVRRSVVRRGRGGLGPRLRGQSRRERARQGHRGPADPARAGQRGPEAGPARERDVQPRGVAVEAVDVHSGADARCAARATARARGRLGAELRALRG